MPFTQFSYSSTLRPFSSFFLYFLIKQALLATPFVATPLCVIKISSKGVVIYVCIIGALMNT